MYRLRFILTAVMLVFQVSFASAEDIRLEKSDVPFFGAQVFIEPGQSQELVDSWFRTLSGNGMDICRIRMFESYMLRPDGTWDFTLFDYAFTAAEKYGVKIYATLFPATAKTDIGGWKFPADEQQKASFSRFIEALVNHYKDSPALYGWVLINEPGLDGNLPRTKFMDDARKKWDLEHPEADFKKNGYPVLMTTRNYQFIEDITTEFLGWIAEEIAKYDRGHDIHVNPAGVFSNYGDYDLPAWRSFLTSLGGSAHPAWHFSYFTRQQFSLAMMTLSEILRSGAGDLPWFMTEIQGGNNTYSGMQAMCPTPEEITQWLWTILGCEGKGGIFWMLNPRSSGIEAGEWAMIDFQGKPSERLLAAKTVSETVRANEDLFRSAKIIPSGIDVVYIKESLWAENLMGKRDDPLEGRNRGAVIKSPVACFKALTERGLNVGMKEIGEYDFTLPSYEGKSIVISNQISIPEYYAADLETFVSKGGTLFVEGLSAFFDEDLHNTMNTGFTFEKLFGGNISEFFLKGNLFSVDAGGRQLPVHMWYGKMAGRPENVTVHEFGKGRVVWFPSNIALGARVSGNYQPLADYLFETLPKAPETVCFDGYHANVQMRTLKTDKGMLVICVNKSGRTETIELDNVRKSARPVTVFASEGCSAEGNVMTLSSEGVLVLNFKKY